MAISYLINPKFRRNQYQTVRCKHIYKNVVEYDPRSFGSIKRHMCWSIFLLNYPFSDPFSWLIFWDQGELNSGLCSRRSYSQLENEVLWRPTYVDFPARLSIHPACIALLSPGFQSCAFNSQLSHIILSTKKKQRFYPLWAICDLESTSKERLTWASMNSTSRDPTLASDKNPENN